MRRDTLGLQIRCAQRGCHQFAQRHNLGLNPMTHLTNKAHTRDQLLQFCQLLRQQSLTVEPQSLSKLKMTCDNFLQQAFMITLRRQHKQLLQFT